MLIKVIGGDMKMTEKLSLRWRGLMRTASARMCRAEIRLHFTCALDGVDQRSQWVSAYQGKVHLFFQHYPYASQWGPMHWGHAVTEGLCAGACCRWRWRRTSPMRRMFSGSALQAGIAMCWCTPATWKLRTAAGCRQSIALGDGIAYTKHPAAGGERRALAARRKHQHFRDPKAWQEKDGTYRMAVANRAEDGSGQILL